MHLALLLEMYRIAKAGVALKMISEIFQLQEEPNYNLDILHNSTFSLLY